MGVVNAFKYHAGRWKAYLPGYDRRNWLRIRQIEAWEQYLAAAEPRTALEISPGDWSPWRPRLSGYEEVHFPDFDITKHRTDRTYDVVIADQVLEHVPWPREALENIRAMTRPGGAALIATPFLFRIHARPHDYHRWTPAGMRNLCIEAGFDPALISVGAWGNKACARAHIGGEPKDYGWGKDLSNDPEYPIMVWAICGQAAE